MSLYKKKMDCPVCKNKFETTRLMNSKLRVESMDTDMFKRYKDIEEHPVKYEAILCPKCGYSAIERVFSKISKRGIEEIKEKIMYKWKPRDYTDLRGKSESITCYKLALYCAEITKKSKVELGGICLRLAWVNRLYGDSKGEERFLNMVHKLYNEAYLKEDLMREGTDPITIGYLIGDISARLGKHEEALKWMNTVIFDRGIANNRTIEKMAREQLDDLKEIVKKERSSEGKDSDEESELLEAQ